MVRPFCFARSQRTNMPLRLMIVMSMYGPDAELRPVGHVDPAEIQPSHRFQRRDQLLARRPRPGATQAFHHDLAAVHAAARGSASALLHATHATRASASLLLFLAISGR